MSLAPSKTYISSLPEWKRDHARSIHRAVYNAAISLNDEEIQTIVKEALVRARKDLSS